MLARLQDLRGHARVIGGRGKQGTTPAAATSPSTSRGCVFCGRCAQDPGAGAVTMGRDFELAARSLDDLRIEVVADDASAPTAGPAPDPDAGAARASSEIHRVLGRSLHLRHFDAGSCNACDWELSALLNPV